MPLHPEALTWTGLLAQWMQFAQAALALREEHDGARWRQSVPAIINLQAVTFALADLHRLPSPEHPLALDKAEMLIAASEAQLKTIWNQVDFPASMVEIIADAHTALRARQSKPQADC